ncbi:MAG: alpha/beta fold hydrolase [Acholeplasma sp.]|jgi:cephalosporin-C deacetylase|nr:MAG: alpha/beta fold hydrolase [Acholeplasma sp.]
MQLIKELLNQHSYIPFDLNYTDHQPLSGQGFSFLSIKHQTIHGTFWRSTQPSKQTWLVLFHGLGAHTNTEGYLSFVKDWLAQGYDVIGMDVRGQGGRTKNHLPAHPDGLYLTGYPQFDDYYYALIYMDSYRLIDICQMIEPKNHIIASGGSQGGALALFVGAMHPKVDLILSDMPSNTDISVLIHESDGGFKAFKSYSPIESWLYSEIDQLSFASMIKVPVLLSTGTLDTVCPSKTCEALYQKLQTKKAMFIYHGFGHGGYDDLHFSQKLKFIRENR